MPPNCENGRTSPAESRTARAQQKIAARAALNGRVSVSHAIPNNAKFATP
jgi:hypothetical protein